MAAGFDTRSYQTSDAGWIVDRHQALYHADEGFDASFGLAVAAVLDKFNAQDDPGSSGWILTQGDRPMGSVFCVDGGDGWAQLRLFFTEQESRGQGAGQALFETCTTFARRQGYRGLFLWTHAEHVPACNLYRRNGPKLVQSRPIHNYGRNLTEQRFEVRF